MPLLRFLILFWESPTIVLHASKVKKMLLFSQNMHLISPHFPTIHNLFESMSINPSFLWVYSAQIGLMAQSVVIGLPRTTCRKWYAHCYSSAFWKLDRKYKHYLFITIIYTIIITIIYILKIQRSQLVQINWVLSHLSRASVLWIPHWTPQD